MEASHHLSLWRKRTQHHSWYIKEAAFQKLIWRDLWGEKRMGQSLKSDLWLQCFPLMEYLNSLPQREVWFFCCCCFSATLFTSWGVQAKWHPWHRWQTTRVVGGLWGEGEARRREGGGRGLGLSFHCKGWQCQPQAFNECVWRRCEVPLWGHLWLRLYVISVCPLTAQLKHYTYYKLTHPALL